MFFFEAMPMVPLIAVMWVIPYNRHRREATAAVLHDMEAETITDAAAAASTGATRVGGVDDDEDGAGVARKSLLRGDTVDVGASPEKRRKRSRDGDAEAAAAAATGGHGHGRHGHHHHHSAPHHVPPTADEVKR